jgi:microcystin-dependent protein
MPLHGHSIRRSNATAGTAQQATSGGFLTNNASNVTDAAYTGTPSSTAGQQLGGAGGNSAHNNMQPFMALSYIIRV